MRRYGFMPESRCGNRQAISRCPLLRALTESSRISRWPMNATHRRQPGNWRASAQALDCAGVRAIVAAHRACMPIAPLFCQVGVGAMQSGAVRHREFGLSPSLTLRSIAVHDRSCQSRRRLRGCSRLPRGTVSPTAGPTAHQRDQLAADVPFGYADGLPRALSNRGWFGWIGHRLPIVGRVCMDQMVVAAPPDPVEGDLADVLGGDGMSADRNWSIGGHAELRSRDTAGGSRPRLYLQRRRLVGWTAPARRCSSIDGMNWRADPTRCTQMHKDASAPVGSSMRQHSFGPPAP